MSSAGYKFALTLVLGTLTEAETYEGDAVETFVSEVQVAAGASESAMIPGGISNPRFLFVFGGEGVDFALVSGENPIHCNPVGGISDRRGIQNIPATGILISNSGAQAVTVTIIAVE